MAVSSCPPDVSHLLSDSLIERAQQVVMPTYKRFPIVFSEGKGVYLTDVEGKRYLDFVAGIAVNTLGHGHPRLVEAIASQAGQLMHCSNLYWTRPQIELAETLTCLAGMSTAFFCNSGAEAVEAALKLARKHQSRLNPDAPRTRIIAMTNSFHGRTFGALSATGQEKYHHGFEPLLPHVIHVPFNDLDALKAQIDERSAAVILEPLQGEGGIQPADVAYLKAVRELCDETGTLLIFDEVQSGVGRTGAYFAWQQSGVQPDIMALAKGLGGGFPIGAIVVSEKVAQSFQPGDHASTFGGNPLACTAALTVLTVLEEEHLLDNVKARGQQLCAGLERLQGQFPQLIGQVRGQGLMLGLVMTPPELVAKVVATCMAQGLLLVGAGADAIRFVPPLVVNATEIDEALAILEQALQTLSLTE
jgi:acetylornithine/N-succinyldiaminopimelate aminotransferase